MTDNPYEPPQTELDSSIGLPGVVVRRRFPLDITAHRTVNIDVDADVLERRVKQAAEFCGYEIAERHEQRWRLQRGSFWHAFYTFRIRKLPTIARIEAISRSQIEIRLHCRSVFTISTPGDAKRFSRELDELVAQIVGDV